MSRCHAAAVLLPDGPALRPPCGAEDPRERDYLKTILHRIYGGRPGLSPCAAGGKDVQDGADVQPGP